MVFRLRLCRPLHSPLYHLCIKERKSQKSFWFRCQIKSLIEVSLSITIPIFMSLLPDSNRQPPDYKSGALPIKAKEANPLSARWDSNPRFQHTNYSSPSYQDGLVLAVFFAPRENYDISTYWLTVNCSAVELHQPLSSWQDSNLRVLHIPNVAG